MSRIARAIISSDDTTSPLVLPSTPAIFPASRGGTGLDTSATSGHPELRNGAWYFPQNHIDLLSFGAVGDGVADDTAAVQAAFDAAVATGAQVVTCGNAIYRVTDPLTITGPLTISGIPPVCDSSWTAPYDAPKMGTWFHFDHLGRGLEIQGPAAAHFAGVHIENVGTFRTQPAPAPGWAPTEFDYDIYIDSCFDTILSNVFVLNATYGVAIVSTVDNLVGRVTVDHFRGGCFKRGIYVDNSRDVVRLSDVHFFPHWANEANVQSYMLANLLALLSARNDTMMVDDFFVYVANTGIYIAKSANGSTTRLKVSNADLDGIEYAIVLDATNTGVTAQFSNIASYQLATSTVGNGLLVQGSGAVLTFTDFFHGAAMKNGVRIEGTGNLVKMAMSRIDAYNIAAAGWAAYEVAAGNTLMLGTVPETLSGFGGPKYSTTGTIIVDEWRAFTPTVTSGTGAITAVGATDCTYKLVGNTVHVQFDIILTTNGTGATDVRFPVPFGVVAHNSGGGGRATVVSGKGLAVVAYAGIDTITITNMDGTYPGADSERLVGTCSYPVTL